MPARAPAIRLLSLVVVRAAQHRQDWQKWPNLCKKSSQEGACEERGQLPYTASKAQEELAIHSQQGAGGTVAGAAGVRDCATGVAGASEAQALHSSGTGAAMAARVASGYR